MANQLPTYLTWSQVMAGERTVFRELFGKFTPSGDTTSPKQYGLGFPEGIRRTKTFPLQYSYLVYLYIGHAEV